MNLKPKCAVCGKFAENACAICGKAFCASHFIKEFGVCMSCRRGKTT